MTTLALATKTNRGRKETNVSRFIFFSLFLLLSPNPNDEL